jgi:hypothetical protein
MVRAVDHSPPSSTKVKNVWRYTSIPLHIFKVSSLIKYRNNFTFLKFIAQMYSTRKILLIFNFWKGEYYLSLNDFALSGVNGFRYAVT